MIVAALDNKLKYEHYFKSSSGNKRGGSLISRALLDMHARPLNNIFSEYTCDFTQMRHCEMIFYVISITLAGKSREGLFP